MNHIKNGVLFSLLVCGISCNSSLFATSAAGLDTTLTDTYSEDKPSVAKNSFSKDTPILYIVWKSNKLKEGQKVQIVWIADDTNNVAPPNYKIDAKELTLSEGMTGKILSHLPGSYWNGTFTMTKPTAGWPLGKYHAEVYVDGELATKIPFTIAQVKTPATKATSGWGAISIGKGTQDETPLYGSGGGNTKEEAEKNAQAFCAEAGAKNCSMVLSYQQCGAYAFADNDHNAVGTGTTKKMAEESAKQKCNSSTCDIIVSDCN